MLYRMTGQSEAQVKHRIDNLNTSQLTAYFEIDEATTKATIPLPVTTQTYQTVSEKPMVTEPVRVEKDGDKELLRYYSNLMEKGKQYEVIWYGKYFVLIKNDDGVDIYRFYPDS